MVGPSGGEWGGDGGGGSGVVMEGEGVGVVVEGEGVGVVVGGSCRLPALLQIEVGEVLASRRELVAHDVGEDALEL